MALDDSQLAELAARGWTTVPGVADSAARAEMLDKVWALFERRGLERADPSTWPEKLAKLQPLAKAGVFDAFLGETVDAIADQLIGQGSWTTLGGRPQALVNMPTATPWQMPHKVWHFDLPGRGPTDTWGAVRYFGLVDNVGPREGSTIIVEGSHELVRRMVAEAPGSNAGSSAEIRKRLRAHDFFARLARPISDPGVFMDEGAVVDGVPVRVAELTGNAGDLIVMHPWMLHNISVNASKRVRIAMSYSVFTTDVSFYGADTPS